MKNPGKTRHRFFRVDRVYIHQNDRLDLTVNEFFTVLKTMIHSRRYSQKCKMKKNSKNWSSEEQWEVAPFKWIFWRKVWQKQKKH